MIRWASCGLIVLLSGAPAPGQSAEAIQEISALLDSIKYRPNPLGGAPIPINLRAVALAAQQKGVAPGAPDQPLPPPGPPAPRPIRPVFTLPGAPQLDRHGDPLPAGAVARYGTVRLRHGTDIHAMGFTPDGKLLCTVSGSEDTIKMWDPATGKEVARLNSAAGLVGLAKNGSVVLIEDTRVRIWTPAANTVRDLPEKTLPDGTNPGALAVHPDGQSFAVGTESKVLLVSAQTGKLIRELGLPAGGPNNNPNGRFAALGAGGLQPPQPGVPPGAPPTRLLYSPDGRWLLGSGQRTGVWLWDLRTGKRVRTYRTEIDFPEYAFSPDITKIAVTGQQLHLYALDSEEPVDGFKGPENVVHFAPRFGPDGKTLFVVQGDATVVPLDAATGEEKEPHDPPEMNLHGPFALAPEGTTVAAIDPSGGIRIWDTKTGKGPQVDRLPPLTTPGISADGKTVTVVDQENKLHTFDAATGAPGKVTELPGEENGLPTVWDFSSRRAAVVVPSGEELEVQIIDVDTGKVVSKYSLPPNSGVPFVSFAAANRDRMTLSCQFGIVVLNPTTGKAVRTFNPGGGQENGVRGALSPDGRLVAVPTHPLTVWEVATGKKRLTIDAVQNAGEIVFSPDARLLATWDETGTALVVDLRTGAVVRRVHADAENGLMSIALSADGKRLAVGTQTGRVTVFDVPTGDTLAPFGGHDGPVTGLSFTADGKKLVSSAQDGTALVWEVPEKPVAVGPADAAVSGFDEAFRLLGSSDAAQAQRGLDYLYKNPNEAAKQAGERLPVPAATPPAKLAELVDDLGSEEFATREAAVKALEKLGGEASAVLKQAVEKSPSSEVRKAAAELLSRIDAPAVRADDLRILRAVEAMENLRAGAGRSQLEKWAAGPAGHRLTVEAAAALARIKALGGK